MVLHVANDVSTLTIMSYNCRGLRSKELGLKRIIDLGDIICLQETWLSKTENRDINTLFVGYNGIADSPNDDSKVAIRGRKHRKEGVAILWKEGLDHFITRKLFEHEWVTAIKISIENRELWVFNIYLPYECTSNEEEFDERLYILGGLIDELDSSSVLICGDLNANAGNKGSVFHLRVKSFCENFNLTWVSKTKLPSDTFTYTSDAWGTNSFIDHFLATEDGCTAIRKIEVLYDSFESDHLPIRCVVASGHLQAVTAATEVTNRKSRVYWDRLTEGDKIHYLSRSNMELNEIAIPCDAYLCDATECEDGTHRDAIISLYTDIATALTRSGEELARRRRSAAARSRPGWTERCAGQYEDSRGAYKRWMEEGRPTSGPTATEKKEKKRTFKAAMVQCKNDEEKLRREKMALSLGNGAQKDFWDEVRIINNAKVRLPLTGGDATGTENVCQMWKDQYETLFTSVVSEYPEVRHVESREVTRVSVAEVTDAIKLLDKCPGPDGLQVEHIRLADKRVVVLISILFSACLSHGFLPNDLMNVTITPIVKDKSKSISNATNYRPIGLANILSKLLERLLLTRLEEVIKTSDNQFGFKKNHGTELCIFTLKEVITKYNNSNTNVFAGFLDASKAYDRVNHSILFKKLIELDFPKYIVKMLIFWYKNQTLSVGWSDSVSSGFQVRNGVRQGSLLAPHLFAVYLDGLSSRLNKEHIGCAIGNVVINHQIYADDIVVLSPSAQGTNRLLGICANFGQENDIIFNPSKCAIVEFRGKASKSSLVPKFTMNGEAIPIANKYKYLGHILKEDLSDDEDINRQRCRIYRQGN